jgi:hypothetical protein
MPINFAMSAMCVVEFLLWAVLAFLFWKRGLHRSFPAMGNYLAFNLAASPVVGILCFIQASPWALRTTPNYLTYGAFYFYAYWLVYVASSVLFFFICIEIIRFTLAGSPGLMKSGFVIFRWAVLISAIVSLSTIRVRFGDLRYLPVIAFNLKRVVCIVELSLLVFLCPSMKLLHLSVRDLAFGIALGFGVISFSDVIFTTFGSIRISLIHPLQFVSEGSILSALGIWIAYSALPVRARNPMERAVDSLCL